MMSTTQTDLASSITYLIKAKLFGQLKKKHMLGVLDVEETTEASNIGNNSL